MQFREIFSLQYSMIINTFWAKLFCPAQINFAKYPSENPKNTQPLNTPLKCNVANVEQCNVVWETCDSKSTSVYRERNCDLFKIPTTLHRDALFNHINLVVDVQ